jgi:hypothetical protein|tara:strand:+ start:974 stop:1963 length:990 start_codon:yes stop_codon:yes gene_type:complete
MISRKIDPIIAASNQSTSDYLRNIDDVFDPAKLKALTKKLNLTEDAILNELQTISLRIDNDEEQFPLLDDINFFDKKSTLEINQFYNESVDQYVLEERVIENEIEAMSTPEPSSELEEIASTLALTADIYIDAKTGVFDVAKMTELLAKQPQNLHPDGGYSGRTPTDDVQVKHNKKVEEGLKKLIALAKEQVNSIDHQSSHTKIAAKEDLDKAKKEIAQKNKTIADILDRDRRLRESNLTNYQPVTRFMIKVGESAYEDYCKRTLVKKNEVNASEHLNQFHVDMREWMDDRVKELSDTFTLQRPKMENGIAWRKMQIRVLQKMSIITTE